VNQPKTVAPQGVHVWVDHGDGRCCCDHGFDSVATLFQNIATGAGGQVVWRDTAAAVTTLGVEH
jgi:hypothetical protein